MKLVKEETIKILEEQGYIKEYEDIDNKIKKHREEIDELMDDLIRCEHSQISIICEKIGFVSNELTEMIDAKGEIVRDAINKSIDKIIAEIKDSK